MNRAFWTPALALCLASCSAAAPPPGSPPAASGDADAPPAASAAPVASHPGPAHPGAPPFGPRFGGPPYGPPRGGPPFGGPPGPPFGPPIFRALDPNGDGTIDAQELARAGAALKSLDANRDGRLTVDELHPPPPPPKPRGAPASFDSRPLPKDEAERRILQVLGTMGQRHGMASVPLEDGRLLRLLVESMSARNVVEIGTSQGYSAICMALALRRTQGKLTTFELDPARAALARSNIEQAGVANLVTIVQGDAHARVKELKTPIDLLFLDADKEGYLDYLQQLLPLVRPGGLIVAHNMNERQADPRYVKAITENPALETLFVHREAMGVGLTLKKR